MSNKYILHLRFTAVLNMQYLNISNIEKVVLIVTMNAFAGKTFKNNHQPFYYIHLFNCSLTQISDQPITWQQPNAFRYVDMINMTC